MQVRVTNAFHIFFPTLLYDDKPRAHGIRQGRNRSRDNIAHHPCALRTTKNAKPYLPRLRHRLIRLVCHSKHHIPHGVARKDELVPIPVFQVFRARKGGGNRFHKRCDKLVHAPQHGILFVHNRRHPFGNRGKHRRHCRIAPEPDHYRWLRP